jgi:hypothetical protein
MPRLETFTTEAFRRVATAASGVMTTEVPISILGSDLRSAMLLVLAMFNESTFASQKGGYHTPKWLPGPARYQHFGSSLHAEKHAFCLSPNRFATLSR